MKSATSIADMIKKDDCDPLRKDKIKIPAATEEEYSVTGFYTAIKMLDRFRYLPWMSGAEVKGPEGERIDENGNIYTPKFTRK